MRLTSSAVAVGALAGALMLVFDTGQQLHARRQALDLFDLRAREALIALADARAGQQAYVAAGQGLAFWMPKVAGHAETAAAAVENLRTTATSAEARGPLMDASATILEFGQVDRRAREYLAEGQQLMAADVVFSEGVETTAQAARLVEAARRAEHLAADAADAAGRRTQVYAGGAAAALAALVLVVLGWTRPGDRERAASRAPGLGLGPQHAQESPAPAASMPRGAVPVLRAAARLCTDFGRVKDLEDVQRLLAEAADVLDASGIVVWLPEIIGGDLRAALAHGYSPQVLNRMTAIPRSADNATAAAYRTGALQIVLARPGVSHGAIVAPLLSPDGCIGALTAEILDGSETSDSVQALATLIAAQLAGVLAASVALREAEPAASRLAAG